MIRLKHNSVGVALCPRCGEPLTNMVLTTSPGQAVYECWKCRETIAVEDVYREVGRTVSDFDKNIVHAICEIDDRLSRLEDRSSENKSSESCARMESDTPTITFNFKNNIPTTLEETVPFMLSSDHKDRLFAEYCQTVIRVIKLKDILKKYSEKKLDFVPECPIQLLQRQADNMDSYISCLEYRMCEEGIGTRMENFLNKLGKEANK